jgi:GntR family transcriptional regulator
MSEPLAISEHHPVNDNIKVARYQQVYSTLRQWITQGHYPPQARLEPENRLCEIFGVSRITVRKALQLLARDGLVKSVQGKGTFLQADTEHKPIHADMNQRIRRARELARNSEVLELSVSRIAASREVSDDLQLNSETEVQSVTYIRVLRDLRIGFVESHFPIDLNIKFGEKDFLDSTLLTILEDKGFELSGIDHLVGATLADTELASHLNLNVGEPLVRVKMIMLDVAHRPIQKVVAFFRADQYEHHLFLARSGQMQ